MLYIIQGQQNITQGQQNILQGQQNIIQGQQNIIQGQQNIIVVALQVDLPFKLFTLLLILQCTIFGQC